MKKTARMPAIHIRVVEAMRDSGFLNAGMPLEMASTPVSAAQPDANARKTMNHVRLCEPVTTHLSENCAALRLGSIAMRMNPTTMRTKNPTMKAYVGMAKI